jgi:hypothetical protein
MELAENIDQYVVDKSSLVPCRITCCVCGNFNWLKKVEKRGGKTAFYDLLK